MNKTAKTVIIAVVCVVCLVAVAAVWYRAMPHKPLDPEEIDGATASYGGKEYVLSREEIEKIVAAFNAAGGWSKTNDSAEPLFELTLTLKDGTSVLMYETGEENTIGVYRDILLKQTQYTLTDSGLYSAIYDTIKSKNGPSDPSEGNSANDN